MDTNGNKTGTFRDYLTETHSDLLELAGESGINVEEFDTVFRYSPESATKVLRDVIRMRNVKDETREQKLEEFKRQYKELIDAAMKARDDLYVARNEYADKNDVRIVVAWDEEEFIRLGRAPRGSKIVPGRDLSRLYAYRKMNNLPMKLRLLPSESDSYIYGELLKDGSIKAAEQTFKKPNDWTYHVYSDAVKRGTRSNTVGSPHKAISVQRNKRGDWHTLDRAWQEMLDATEDHFPEEEAEEEE